MSAPTIVVERDARVLVLTGAGASADSGIPTFRDAGGLWESHRVEDVGSPAGFRRDPQLVWRFYSERREGVLRASPNAGHAALAELEAKLEDRFLLATQNVDGLHLRAGSTRVLELHGSLLRTRCACCDREPFPDVELYASTIPFCARCDARGETGILRPDIVWFGEALKRAHLDRLEDFVRGVRGPLIFVAIGTSGAVYPAAGIVGSVRRMHGRTWLVNAVAADNAAQFDHVVLGRSAQILPTLFDVR